MCISDWSSYVCSSYLRSLSEEDDPRGADEAVVPCLVRLGAARHAFDGERGAQESHRMILQRQPRRLVIGDDVFGFRHGRQRDVGLRAQLARSGGGEQRQCGGGRAADLSESGAAIEEIGRGKDGTPVTNVHIVCRFLLVTKTK